MSPRIGLLAILLLLFTSCGPNEDSPLRIGTMTWPGAEYLFLAQEKGFFQQAGVPVELVEFSSLGDCRRAFDDGQLDGMAVTLVELIHSLELARNQPRVVLVMDNSLGADVILARKPIKHLSDLRGKRVGVEVSTVGGYLLHQALERAGLAIEDLTLVVGNQPELEQLFLNQNLDAMVTHAPYATRLEHATQAHPIFTSQEIPGEILDVLAVNAGLLATRGEQIARLPIAWDRSLAYAHAHPEEADSLMARREAIPVDAFRLALHGMEMIPLAQQAPFFGSNGLLLPMLHRVHDFMTVKGLVRIPQRDQGNEDPFLPAVTEYPHGR